MIYKCAERTMLWAPVPFHMPALGFPIMSNTNIREKTSALGTALRKSARQFEENSVDSGTDQ